MPMKWTPENDQMLLLKILETSEISVDAKAISHAWPKDGDHPTARAVSERLVKIRSRSNASGSGAANFSVTSGRGSQTTPKSTPKKTKANGTAGGGKRKRARTEETAIESEPEIVRTEDLDGVENPPKKIKTLSSALSDAASFLDEVSNHTEDTVEGVKDEVEAF